MNGRNANTATIKFLMMSSAITAEAAVPIPDTVIVMQNIIVQTAKNAKMMLPSVTAAERDVMNVPMMDGAMAVTAAVNA